MHDKDSGATPQRSGEAGSIAAPSATARHTPAPWRMETVRTSVGVCHKIGPFPTGFAHKPESWACVYEDGMSKQVEWDRGTLNSELIANAHLIAAAPEMLEVLKTWTHDGSLQTFESRERFRKVALAAIAKAEGRSDE